MGISEDFCDAGIPYYRGGDVHSFFIENSRPEYYLPNPVYNRPALKRSHLAQGDVLVTIVGTIGNVAMVTTDSKATCNCKIAILRPNCNEFGAYLATYLSSSYGQRQIQRIVRGSVQMGLVLDDLGKLPVPKFGIKFSDSIALVVNQALSFDNQCKQCIADAETALLRELGFADWRPPTKTVAVRKFSDFISVCRFDAEYFHPDCDSVENLLREYPNGFVPASEMLVEGLVKGGSSQDEKYVELADIGASGEIIGCTSAPFEDLPSRARQRVHM